ncbi:MAG: uracil-DNA glycosylase [Anaerolineae bacterium]|nr:uracil-DNA glycosylase [Thermoflexales bacterium]MDW8406358.1 uracil-DNA glycosylase [Anaerolineae bacterium]
MENLHTLASAVRTCTSCPLHHTRTNAVPGEGPANAEVMFIGEGPGFNEDKQGRPFVGAAGQFLNELLQLAGFKREEVYITNVVKCRPPGNRDPLPEEIEACARYLDRQIELINPKVIVTLGRFSMARWFPNEKISVVHGRAKRADGRIVVAMFHPAAALHQQSLRATVEEDFRRLKQIVAEAQRKAEEKPAQPSAADQAEQLSLF